MIHENTANMHMLINVMKGLYKSMEREWDEFAQQYGMTNAHLHVLWILSYDDGLKLTDLATKGVWNLSTTHDIVTRMAKRGLIRKEKDAEDGRITRVYITKEGMALKNKTRIDFDNGYSFKLMKAIDELGEEDKKKFFELLNTIEHKVLDSDFIDYVQNSTERLNKSEGVEK